MWCSPPERRGASLSLSLPAPAAGALPGAWVGVLAGGACCAGNFAAKSFGAPATRAAIAAVLPTKFRRVLIAIKFLLSGTTLELICFRRWPCRAAISFDIVRIPTEVTFETILDM